MRGSSCLGAQHDAGGQQNELVIKDKALYQLIKEGNIVEGHLRRKLANKKYLLQQQAGNRLNLHSSKPEKKEISSSVLNIMSAGPLALCNRRELVNFQQSSSTRT